MGLDLAQPKAQPIWAGPGRAGPNRPWAENFWPKPIPTGEVPFECLEYGKKFAQLSNLKVHNTKYHQATV